MPDMNDFHAFNSTSGNDSNDVDCGVGCLSPTGIAIAIILFIIYFIGKISG